jgi:carboxypeptidase PM20D1
MTDVCRSMGKAAEISSRSGLLHFINQEERQMKRKIGIAVGALFIAVIAIVAVRTALYTSKQMKVEAAAPIRIDAAKAAKHLSQAVTFKTISYQDASKFDKAEFIAFHRFLEKTYPKIHAKLKRETVNGYSLLYTWKGTDTAQKPILLMAHMDVVPVEPGTDSKWTRGAFSGDITDGYIWGRGTLDIKVAVIGILEAVENLLEKGIQPRRTVYLAFGHDEEIGGRAGAVRIVELLSSRGVRLDFVLDEGGSITDGIIKGINAPVALVGIAEKGYLSVEFTVESEGGHSSMPPKETAAGIIATAISRLQKNPFPEKISGVTELMFKHLGPEMSPGNRVALSNMWLLGGLVKSQLSASNAMAAALHTTIAPTMLQGSVKENILPSKAVAVVNFRILPGDSIAGVIDYVKKTVDDPRVSIKTLGWADEPSPISDPESANFMNIHKTIKQIFPGMVVTPYLVLGATDSRHYTKISDQVFRFTPTWMKPEDLKRAHGINERVAVSNFEQCVKFFSQLLRNTVM